MYIHASMLVHVRACVYAYKKYFHLISFIFVAAFFA